MITVLLADDEPLVRAGVASILGSDGGIEVTVEAGDGRTAVDLARLHRPDVAVLDIQMPALGGLAAAREIRVASPETAVVMLTTFGDDDYVDEALDAGASGFLLKACDPRGLITGVRAAHDGGAYLAPAVAARVVAEFRRTRRRDDLGARARVERLTTREREVLAMVGAGLSNAQIARRLFIVEGTVKTHVGAIFTTLGVGNRVQAAILAHQAGLVAQDGPPDT